MSIEIVVRDPANTPAPELTLVIEMLEWYRSRGDDVRPAAAPMPPAIAAGLANIAATVGTLAPSAAQDAKAGLDLADDPSAGVDVLAPVAFGGNPVEAFGGDLTSAAEQAFAGNVQPPPAAGSPAISASGTASLPPAAPLAPSNTAATAGVDLDADGLPHDLRIHAGSKAKNADGRWRRKPRLDDATLASVTAELRALMAVPGAPVQQAPAAPNVSPGLPPAPPAPPLAPITAPTAAATIPTAPTGAVSFVTIMQRVGALIMAGTLTEAEANSAVQAVGLQAYPQLVQRPDLAQQVSDTLDALVASKG